jgi:fluoride exporter
VSLSGLVCVGVGGALGSCARYALSAWFLRAFGPSFPSGTLAVNVIGSLLLGAIMWIAFHTSAIGPNLRLALTTGVMGGFTTYSAFNFELLRFFQERAWAIALVYLGATVFGCLAAGWLGWAGASWILGGRELR